MADSNNSSVSIVAIIAIVILVAGGLYFVWTYRSGDSSPTIDVDIEEVPLIEDNGAIPVPGGITVPV